MSVGLVAVVACAGALLVYDVGRPPEATQAFAEPVRRIAPGQSVVLYDGDRVLGGGVAT